MRFAFLFVLFLDLILWSGCSQDASDAAEDDTRSDTTTVADSGTEVGTDVGTDSGTGVDTERGTDTESGSLPYDVAACRSVCSLGDECGIPVFDLTIECNDFCEAYVPLLDCEISLRPSSSCKDAELEFYRCRYDLSTCEQIKSFDDGMTAIGNGDDASEAYACSIEYQTFEAVCAVESDSEDAAFEALMARECADEIAAFMALAQSTQN